MFFNLLQTLFFLQVVNKNLKIAFRNWSQTDLIWFAFQTQQSREKVQMKIPCLNGWTPFVAQEMQLEVDKMGTKLGELWVEQTQTVESFGLVWKSTSIMKIEDLKLMEKIICTFHFQILTEITLEVGNKDQVVLWLVEQEAKPQWILMVVVPTLQGLGLVQGGGIQSKDHPHHWEGWEMELGAQLASLEQMLHTLIWVVIQISQVAVNSGKGRGNDLGQHMFGKMGLELMLQWGIQTKD